MHINFRKIIVIFSLFFLASACDAQKNNQTNTYPTNLKIKDKIISVAIADTPEKQIQGLSGQKTLGENQGMLFKFSKQSQVSFWMKDMNFNLDIIWIENKKIIGITADVPAPVNNKRYDAQDTSLPRYSSPGPVDAVLEVNAGWSKKNNIKVGDELSI